MGRKSLIVQTEKFRLRYSELSLLLFVFLIPIEDFFLQDIIGSSTRIAGGIMILIYYLTEPAPEWRKTPASFYLYFLWAILSIIAWSDNPQYYAIIRLVMWMLTTVVAANIISRNNAILPLIFKVYTISSLYLVYVALSNFTNIDVYELERVDVEGMNQNLLATQFLICLAYLLYNYFRVETSQLGKSVSIGFIVLFLLGIIATGSRSTLLSVLLAFLLFLPKNSFRFSTVMQVCLIFLVGYILVSGDNKFSRFLNARIEAAETDKGANRTIIWKVAENMIKDNPVMGVGYRNFPTEFGTYLESTHLVEEEWERLGERRFAGTHNAVLETWSELGTIGLLLFYGFQYKFLRTLYRGKSEYSWFVIVLLIAINFNALFGDLANLKYFWLIIALCMAIMFKNNKEVLS